MINYKGTIVRTATAYENLDNWQYVWAVQLENSRETLPLHPEDVNQIHELSKVFDNIEARILSNPTVQYNIVSAITTSGGISCLVHYAKLVQSLSIETPKEVLYTKDEVANLLQEYRSYAFHNGLSPSKLDQWFEENV